MKITIPTGIANYTCIVSVSGGKDSTATVLALREAGVSARYVFADTGWEAQQTYDHIDDLARRLDITIDRVGVDGGMVGRIMHYASFPARKQRWCTRELKVQVIRAYHERVATDTDAETVSVVGIRNAESTERALIENEFEWDKDWKGYVWRPILRWDVAEVLAIHHRHNIPVNPLYRLGFGRVGCNPCIYASKEEIELVAQHFPQRIAQIDSLEKAVNALRAARNVEKPGRHGDTDATFFQARQVDHYDYEPRWFTAGASKKELRGSKPIAVQPAPPEGQDQSGQWRLARIPVYRPMPIADVVAWSRTTRGGRQLKVIREEPQGGCFRWGMCEPPESGSK